ncbi:MAG: TRAP transporter substrate-binding protein [Deltaproteobacteria bacterium]|nr:TRAP transporter substrate-binding protein [Deltaproteobacteria bacterium]
MRGKAIFCVVGMVVALCLFGSGVFQTDAAAAEAKTFKWKMVTAWPPKFPVVEDAITRMIKNIETMSQGRLKIEHHPGGTLIPPLETFEAVRGGMAEMGSSCSYYWGGKIPEAPIFTTVPYGMTPQERTSWLYNGGGLQLWHELYAPFNIVPFAMINTGVQMAGWFKKEIKSLADLKGLKMRIPGFGGKVMAKAGVNVVLLPPSEIFVSLERGVIDAADWIAPYHDKRMGLHQAAKYYYYPGWQEPSTVGELLINKKAWESLPEDLKVMIQCAAADCYIWSLGEFDSLNGDALKELVEKHGVKVSKFPDDVMAQLKKLSAVVLEEEAAKSPKMKKIYDAFKDFKGKTASWTKVSTEAFLDARAK